MDEQIIEIDEDGKVHGNDLESALASALNRFSAENGSNTPDFILAQYLLACLDAFNKTSRARESWYGRELRIGGSSQALGAVSDEVSAIDPIATERPQEALRATKALSSATYLLSAPPRLEDQTDDLDA